MSTNLNDTVDINEIQFFYSCPSLNSIGNTIQSKPICCWLKVPVKSEEQELRKTSTVALLAVNVTNKTNENQHSLVTIYISVRENLHGLFAYKAF